MGLFDKLASIGKKIASSEVTKKINMTVEKSGIKDKINDLVGETVPDKTYTIPGAYSEFPILNGKITSLVEREETSYKRCTIKYNNIECDEMNNYVALLEKEGYKRYSKVRLDKDNTYIITEYNRPELRLVFHIKK